MLFFILIVRLSILFRSYSNLNNVEMLRAPIFSPEISTTFEEQHFISLNGNVSNSQKKLNIVYVVLEIY